VQCALMRILEILRLVELLVYVLTVVGHDNLEDGNEVQLQKSELKQYSRGYITPFWVQITALRRRGK
jgi:hypothetical protein